jgi:hypothetical protein
VQRDLLARPGRRLRSVTEHREVERLIRRKAMTPRRALSSDHSGRPIDEVLTRRPQQPDVPPTKHQHGGVDAHSSVLGSRLCGSFHRRRQHRSRLLGLVGGRPKQKFRGAAARAIVQRAPDANARWQTRELCSVDATRRRRGTYDGVHRDERLRSVERLNQSVVRLGIPTCSGRRSSCLQPRRGASPARERQLSSSTVALAEPSSALVTTWTSLRVGLAPT